MIDDVKFDFSDALKDNCSMPLDCVKVEIAARAIKYIYFSVWYARTRRRYQFLMVLLRLLEVTMSNVEAYCDAQFDSMFGSLPGLVSRFGSCLLLDPGPC